MMKRRRETSKLTFSFRKLNILLLLDHIHAMHSYMFDLVKLKKGKCSSDCFLFRNTIEHLSERIPSYLLMKKHGTVKLKAVFCYNIELLLNEKEKIVIGKSFTFGNRHRS